MNKYHQVLAGAAISIFAGAASANMIIDNTSQGWYNASLGDLAATYGSGSFYFPGQNVSEGDPTRNFPSAPVLDSTPQLGNWLSGDFSNIEWVGPTSIPGTWAVNTETAIAYEFTLDQSANISVDLGVDNGIFAWINGDYQFDAMAGGGSIPGEYAFSTTLGAGTHYLQLLREDHGGRTGFDVMVSAVPVPEPASLALLGLGLLGVGLSRRKA